MSNPREREPQEKEANQVTVNLGGFVVGVVLLACLVWAILSENMQFAILNTFLLFALAVFNHGLNVLYR